MKKVLFVATVDSHIIHFHIPYLKWFKEKGFEVHVATNGHEKIDYCDKKHKICIERSPFKLNNIKAYKSLKKIISLEKFDIIHCHTPMGSVITRLAAKKERRKSTKVIYTAHGFHFYKGAPLINWLLYYPIEKWLSKYTDCLITINKEDYGLAKRKFKTKQIEYVPGVGIDKEKFNINMTDEEKINLRREIGCKENSYIAIYVAEISNRKNQIFLINIFKKIFETNNDIHLILAGSDSLKGKCQKLVNKFNLNGNIHFLGYRKDIARLIHISNIVVSSSKQEGLPINIIEAMAIRKPIIATNCRGNRDLIENGKNGFIVSQDDSGEFANTVLKFYNGELKIDLNNKEVEKYIIEVALSQVSKIYLNYL